MVSRLAQLMQFADFRTGKIADKPGVDGSFLRRLSALAADQSANGIHPFSFF